MMLGTQALMVAFFLAAKAVAASDDANHPEHAAHSAGVNHRGDQAMGFPHEKTAHHFALTTTGGTILATPIDPKDSASRRAIVGHFHHIAAAFQQGNFDMPMFVHDRVPPGVPEMKRLASEIHYEAEETTTGARVVVSTRNPAALRAIHQFLRFQIKDHRTGDSTAVQP